MDSLHSDDWTDETIPTRHVRPDSQDSAEAGGVARTRIPVLVWLLGGAVVVLMLVVGGLWALYLLRGQMASAGPTPTPIIWTPTSAPTSLPTSTPTDEPTPPVSPDIAIGRYVRVTGTEGYGLSLREGPGENYTRMDVAAEGDVFIVVNGPTVVAGSEWWEVRDPENEERQWWAIGNFLEPVEHS